VTFCRNGIAMICQDQESIWSTFVLLYMGRNFWGYFLGWMGCRVPWAGHPRYNVGVTTWDPCSKRFQMGWALDKASCLTCFTEYESWNMFLIRFHSLVQGEAFHTFSGSLRTSGGGWDQGRRVPFCGISGGYWMILVYVDYSLIDG